jgi:hypothetical protein
VVPYRQATRRKKPVRKTVLCITFLALALAEDLPAAIAGAFNFNGSITVTQIAQTWKSDTNVADQATIGSTGLSGSFAGLGGTTIDIQDLNRFTEPVDGAGFAPQAFIDFVSMPGPVLNITFIALGAFPSTDCHNPVHVAGQVCTLSSADVPGGSPFMFTNTSSTGGAVDGSSATWSMRGTTSDGGLWSGIWTAQFNESYQDVFATFFGPAAQITNTYSASITVVTPEPPTNGLLGAGLVLVSLVLRRQK